MIILETIAQELADKEFGSLQGPDQDIFVWRMNEDVDSGILLTNRLTGSQIDVELPHYRMTRFHAICRGTDKRSPIDRCHAISRNLHGSYDRTMGTLLFKEIVAMTDPIPYPLSDGDYNEAMVRFEARYVITDFSY